MAQVNEGSHSLTCYILVVLTMMVFTFDTREHGFEYLVDI